MRTIKSPKKKFSNGSERLPPKRTSLTLNNIDEKEEHLLMGFDTMKEDFQLNMGKHEFYIEEYDQQCEDHLKIKKIIPLRQDKSKLLIYIILNIVTLTLVNLLLIWLPKLKLKLIYSITSIKMATTLGVYGTNQDHDFQIVDLKEIFLQDITGSPIRDLAENNIRSTLNNKIIMFDYKLFKYFYSLERKTFLPLKFILKGSYINIEKRFLKGLNNREVEYQKNLYGKCDIKIEIESFVHMLMKELTDPFYVFQIFSIILWFNNSYIKYAVVIIVSTIISLLISVIETRKNMFSIKQMAKYSVKLKVFRHRNNKREEKVIDSKELVPGDLFEMPDDNVVVPCDCLVMNGTVIMNESILTGESIPVIKQHLPNTHAHFDQTEKRFVLYSGTRIIQKRSMNGQKILGLVLKTGFNTEKGSLIRAILFPKENHFKFREDSISYIKIMGCLSLLGFLITLPFMISNNISYSQIMFRFLDLITTTVPPALPACLGIGISYALLRIKEKGIICINRDRVNEAGKINLICFDKTGTLTEDHLDVFGFRPLKGNFTFDNYIKIEEVNSILDESYSYMKNKHKELANKTTEIKSLLIECMSTCHSITRVNGNLIGDPIDIKMFQSTNWVLNENLENEENYDPLVSTFVRPARELSIKEKVREDIDNEEQIFKSHYELGIVRRFDFASKLQRMSVIVKNANEENFKVFCKGSPEKIRELCKNDTIPDNFNEILSKYTHKGFRVLAFAFKLVKMHYIQSQRISREDTEKNLMFLGLLIVQNKLKDTTKESIQILKQADMKMIMATGDNIMTAISVAKECNLINPKSRIFQLDLGKDDAEMMSRGKLCFNLIENFEDREEATQSLEIGLSFNRCHSSPKLSDLSQDFHPEVMSLNTQLSFNNSLGKDKDSFISYGNGRQVQKRKNSNLSSIYEMEVDNNNLNNFSGNESDPRHDVIAITGNIFELLCKLKSRYLEAPNKREQFKQYLDLYKLVLQQGFIYARMSPENKTKLIEDLKDESYRVLMCGDGANDCGALRAANVGVSLGIEEASIAAHFTSNTADISCIKSILIEGKAALVTTVQCFKYMMLYSVIQFSSVTIMVVLGTYLSDNQFLMSDLFLIFPLALLIAKTDAIDSLTREIPVFDLKSLSVISSIILQSILQFFTQYFSYLILKSQTWFVPLTPDEDDNIKPNFENTTVFLISYIQFLITAVAFSIGKPFKQNFYSNHHLCAFLTITMLHGYYLILCSDYFSNWLFTSLLFTVSIFNFALSLLIEKLIVPRFCDIVLKWKQK